MVNEAIRNGTYVAPTPAVRQARVDLSNKPELWEAYLGGGGWQLGSVGQGSGKEFEYSRDWESIKPIYAGYAEPLTAPCSGPTPNHTGLSPPVFIPSPTSAPRRDNDEENRLTAEVSNITTPSLLARAKIFLKPNSTTPASSSADNGTNSRSNSANISMTELNSNTPPTIRVAVLIAMPSPSSHRSSTPLSASLSSNTQPTTSHPFQLSSPSPTLRLTDDDEPPLPHIEMGVADVVMGRSENSSTWDSAHSRREEKTGYSRGSNYV